MLQNHQECVYDGAKKKNQTTCAYQAKINVSFSENFANVLNEWSQTRQEGKALKSHPSSMENCSNVGY